MKVLIVPTLLAALLAPGAPATTTGALKSIDVYGTRRLTAAGVSRQFGAEIREMAAAFNRQDVDRFIRLQEEVAARVRRRGPFAFVRVSLIQSWDPGMPFNATLDVVEERDRARRMEFLSVPTGTFSDSEGILALWHEYETKGAELVRKGELKSPSQESCPAFHCLYGFEHPDLAPYLPRLDAGARAQADTLFRILREDRDAGHRGAAVYLLAHTQDPARLTAALVRAMRDPDASVRNSATRVLAMISLYHPKVVVPLAPVLAAIDYPETTDRNKALYVLDGLANRAQNRERITRQAGPALLRLLRLRQPNNHDPAWSILKKISGKTYGDRDYRAWERWFARTRSRYRHKRVSYQ